MNTAGWIAVAIWLVLGLEGVWFAATGRKGVFGLPRDYHEGWPVRVFGAAYVVLAALAGIGMFLETHGTHLPFGLFEAAMGIFAVLLLGLLIWGRPRRVEKPA